jgi:hypothetical protein
LDEKMKKELERWQLERFKKTCPSFPQGEIIESERPDFLIENSAAKVGIELTQLYRSDSHTALPPKATESLRQQVVDRAHSLYKETGGPPLWVTVFFSLVTVLRKSMVTELASRVADLVTAVDADMNARIKLEAESDASDFPDEIDSIHIRRLPILTEGFWNTWGVGFIPTYNPDQLQEILDRKEKSISSYRDRCDATWLVIVVGGFAISSTVNFADSVYNHSYTSSFDRVFVFKNADEKSFELKV